MLHLTTSEILAKIDACEAALKSATKSERFAIDGELIQLFAELGSR